MNSYYELLGIREDADDKEVKASYFRAVRQYPPDSDPEMFKKVRKAYETLSDRKSRGEYDQLAKLDPLQQSAYNQILLYQKAGNYDQAIKCCQEVISASESGFFSFILGKLYIKNDNPGKAARIFENLLNISPDRMEYLLFLFEAYWERGWRKKAEGVCKKLEKLGCEFDEFHLIYGAFLADGGSMEEAFEQLHAISGGPIDLEVAYRAWLGIFQRAVHGSVNYSSQCIKSFLQFDRMYAEQKEEMSRILMGVMMELFCYDETVSLGLEQELAGQMLERLRGYIRSGVTISEESWLIYVFERKLEAIALFKDQRLHKEILEHAEIIYLYGVMVATGEEERWKLEQQHQVDFCVLEMMRKVILLEFVTKLPGIRKSMEIIKNEYLLYAQGLGSFLDELLQCQSRAFLLNKYEKKVKKAERNLGAFDYPFEDEEDNFFFGHDREEPFRRPSPKVGRNEPCPCGSGKKYKNCCGKN